MTMRQILILAVVQRVAELLHVSSSTHVIVAEKLMRLDPTSPEMTLRLVMLHTGTMFGRFVMKIIASRKRRLAGESDTSS
jgi:undecaprenyl-diphosphatase